MQIDISFRHMDPSDTLRDYADEKIRRVIRKHIRDDFDAQITLSVEKFRHIAKLHLTYKGISIKCEESSEDMYQSIDLALDKLESQIHRYKGKLRAHKQSSRPTLPLLPCLKSKTKSKKMLPIPQQLPAMPQPTKLPQRLSSTSPWLSKRCLSTMP